jgi:hypothetical protein
MDWQQLLPAICFLGCILPIGITVIGGAALFYFGKRWLEQLTTPDVSGLVQEYNAKAAQKTPVEREKIAQQIIHRQALKCGAVGFVTGFGGFFTLPIALPVDLVLSTHWQATIVSFIAQIYGFPEDRESRFASSVIMIGSGQVAEKTTAWTMRGILWVVGKSFSKLIPFISAIVAFVVNYFMARYIGYAALRWYKSKVARAAT